jgi:uncharacterized membrane protein
MNYAIAAITVIIAITPATAADADSRNYLVELLPWLGLVLLLVILLVTAIYLGKRLLLNSFDASQEQPFTLQTLRELHASGQLSDEEFAKARDAMIGRVKSAAADTSGPADDADNSASHDDKTDEEQVGDDSGSSGDNGGQRPDNPPTK